VSAIGLHHSIDRAGAAPLADIVHDADPLCRTLAFGNPSDDGVIAIEPGRSRAWDWMLAHSMSCAMRYGGNGRQAADFHWPTEQLPLTAI
jgi:hypothetical protein